MFTYDDLNGVLKKEPTLSKNWLIQNDLFGMTSFLEIDRAILWTYRWTYVYVGLDYNTPNIFIKLSESKIYKAYHYAKAKN